MSEDTTRSTTQNRATASFLQAVMSTSSRNESDTPTAPLQSAGYHLEFYQQLPDFIMAQLATGPEDPTLVQHYRALLLHLAGCPACHGAYLDIYGALKEPDGVPETGPLHFHMELGRQPQATPPSALEHFCRTLITQAEAILSQRDQRPQEEEHQNAARELLQIAIRVGGTIRQKRVRHRALADLVRVALLAEPLREASAALSYALAFPPSGLRSSWSLAGAGVEEEEAITVHAGSLRGRITQNERCLTLHLKDLNEAMRGHHIVVSFPLGTLFEPVRWYGHPRALVSPLPVGVDGAVEVPLGETDLRMSNHADTSLLEVLFLLVEIRLTD